MNINKIDLTGPHRRQDPLTGRWVTMAPREMQSVFRLSRQAYPDTNSGTEREAWCIFCAGNHHPTNPDIERLKTPDGLIRTTTRKDLDVVVTTDLLRENDGLYDCQASYGADEAVVIGENHSLRLTQLPNRLLAASLGVCLKRIASLNGNPNLKNAIFWTDGNNMVRDKGYTHPLWHVTASTTVFQRIFEEILHCHHYHTILGKERCLICDIIREEIKTGIRLVHETDNLITLVPHGSRYPFETWIVPKTHSAYFEDFGNHINDLPGFFIELADAIQVILKKLEIILGARYAFSLVLFNAPRRLSYIPAQASQSPINSSLAQFYHWRLRFKPSLIRQSMQEDATGECTNRLLPCQAANLLKMTEEQILAAIK